MTIEEKRKKIEEYCDSRDHCEGKENCPLNSIVNGACYSDNADVEFNYSVLFDENGNLKSAKQADEKMKYWSNICKMQKKQTEKGLKKYGQILEENTGMTILERLEYLEEELIDGLMYLEHIKELLTKGETNVD